MILVYRETPSESANKLVAALRELGAEARRVKRWRTVSRYPSDSPLVFWGSHVPAGHVLTPARVATVLNGAAPARNKLQELQALADAGIQVPAHSLTRPVTYEMRCEHSCEFGHSTMPGRPLVDASYVPRRFNHMGGRDLLSPPSHPDYWVQRVDVDKEFRVHVFQDRVLRLGVREPAHPGANSWIRSYDAGWRLSYGNAANRDGRVLRRVRQVAKAAVRALGLDFGAVDVGWRSNTNAATVFEVNSAPGLDGGTLSKYAAAIKAWSLQ